MSDLREAAKNLAAKGFSVFKVRVSDKKPAYNEWYNRAQNDPDKVFEHWSVAGESQDYNIGVLCGALLPDNHRLHVIDVDNKGKYPGWPTLDRLKAEGLPMDTLTVRTPSGGIHLYYKLPMHWPDLSNTAGKLGPGVDTRGRNGYVLGPGSIAGDKTYVVEKDLPIATLPEWMLPLLKPVKERADNAGQWLCEPDGNLERAREHVERYPVPPEGQRNQQMHMLAVDLRDLGVTANTAIAMMASHWPLMEDSSLLDELEKTVHSAYKSAKLPAGLLTADAQFEDISGELEPSATQSPAQIARSRFRFESIDDILNAPDITWLVNGWIPEGQPGMFYGPSGSYKSFVALDLGLHLAHGWDSWHGVSIPGVPCNVLVIASEGRAGFKKRIKAFNAYHGVAENPKTLQFMTADVNFMRDADFKGLCDAIKELGTQFRLIIVDTVQRVTAGVDSNTQEYVSLFMERCRKLGAIAGNAATLAVHHTNKTGTLLGSGVFKNESDFLFKVEKLPSAVKLFCEKLKDDEDGWAVNAGLEEFRFGDSQHTKSMVVTDFGERAEAIPSETDPPKGRRTPTTPGVTIEQAERVLAAIQAAWDRGLPWNLDRIADNPRNLYDNASVVAGVSRDKIKPLIDKWKSVSCGVLRVDRLRVGAQRIAGYRVVGTLDNDGQENAQTP